MISGGWRPGARPYAVAARCVRTTFARARCDRCQRVCPRGAITLERGVRVGGDCSACGACVAACPSAAIVDPAGDERALGHAIAAAAQRDPDRVARLACRAAGAARGELEVPCLGRLSADALLWAATNGVADVRGSSVDCARCPEREAVLLLSETIATATALAAVAGARLSFRHLRGTAPPLAPISEPRRALFRSLFGLGRERAVAPSPAELVARAVGRRGALLAEVRRHRDLEGRPGAGTVRGTPGASEHGWPFGVVAIDSRRCVGCPVCAVVCPTGAIHRVAVGTTVTITVTQDGCTACGACAQACLPGAIVVRPAAAPELLAGSDRMVVACGSSCPTCGRPSRPGHGERCATCAVRSERLGLRP